MINSEPFLIAKREQIESRVQDLNKRSEDIKSRLAPTLKKLWNPERQLAVVTCLEAFRTLRSQFPHFIEVIDLLEASATGLEKLGMPFESPPILLSGEPGLGKTLFASELAKLTALPYFEISVATTTASFALSGGNIQWAEGSVGFIAKSLIDSAYANPLILIDEIDKASDDSRYNPLNPFYSLLETHSSKRFKDEALEIELDASRIIWVATANYLEQVPAPILSRMTVIDIKSPNSNQMVAIVNSIYSNFRNSKPYGKLLSPTIQENAMDKLRTKSPREAKLAIDQGCLKAICHNRSD